MRDLLGASTAWLDQWWDADARLVWTVQRDHHMTRESVSYALGLLQRAGPGDEAKAWSAIERVLAQQYPLSAGPHGGTWRRAPEEDDPPSEPVMWIHYDPNWRWFIGTTLALICDTYDVPDALRDPIGASIALAVSSEPPDRVASTYANIALMKAWLERWQGERSGDADLIARGEKLAREVAAHFHSHDAFLEYNSPTYYGIDLWALALWRRSDGVLAELGPRIEHALWRDIARFYHGGLRNVCGPYDRSYGMDMTRYAATLGLWIWSAIGRDRAPFPDTSGKFGHPHDFAFGTAVAATGEPHIPDDVVAELTTFSGERTVERTFSRNPDRVATAWLGPQEMIGAQTGPPSGIGFFQHHHATMHWRAGDGIGWARLLPDVPAVARASANRLEIEADTTYAITFEFGGPATDDARITAEHWNVGGRTIDVETNASHVTTRTERGRVLASYEPATGPTRFVIAL